MNHSAAEHFPENVRNIVIALIETKLFERLKKISFLGAIESLRNFVAVGNTQSAGSRYDHSLGVAVIVAKLREFSNFSEGEFRIALVHALLHDIGHGPLSHSTERFFRSYYSIDHHKALEYYISNEENEISRILKIHGLYYDYKKFIQNPERFPFVSAMFFGPINADTIEGILRAAAFFGTKHFIDERQIINSLCMKKFSYRRLDEFWRLKSQIYNEYIFSANYSVLDEAIFRALTSARESTSINDFFLNDSEFQQKYSRDVSMQLHARDSWLTSSGVKQRNFEIIKRETPNRFLGLGRRYVERNTRDVRARI